MSTSPFRVILPTDRLPHGYQIAATVLLSGAGVTLAHYLATKGLLELASTGLSFFAVALIRQTGATLTGRVPKEFTGTATAVDRLRSEWRSWIQGRAMLSHVLIAATYTALFLGLRSVTGALLGVLSSPWLALAAGLTIAGAVASPAIFRAAFQSLGSTGRRTDTSQITEGDNHV